MPVDSECRVRVWASGTEYVKGFGPHDWRLYSIEQTRSEARLEGLTPIYLETWYCTRCRLVERREPEIS